MYEFYFRIVKATSEIYKKFFDEDEKFCVRI